MNKSLQLLEQIIELAKAKDESWKQIHRQLHQASQSIGEDTIVFHLQQLKELIQEESQTGNAFVPP